MNNAQTEILNARFKKTPAIEIVRWVVEQSDGRVVVSTNFRPYEAVILHLCIQVKHDIPVLWVDHGYNRPATYRFSQKLCEQLRLNLKIFLPKLSAAHRDAVYGPVPEVNDEAGLQKFSEMMKLEPFERGMKELAPTYWITALRKVQNPNRAEMDIFIEEHNLDVVKVNPVFYWTDADMEDCLNQNGLPNEWDYFDPAKADEKRECGLHVRQK